mmetsp:Transcript_38577/g.123645  ORF Transcript_38577/g.123645 Transcript_38577/m.123645 type:complete len:85 (+) Transcript_38577:162-416(+)
MIYDVNSAYFQSFLSNSKKQPTTDEIVDALADLKKKKPGQSPEELAVALRVKYPTWVLEDVDWVDLSDKVDNPEKLEEDDDEDK